MNLNKLYIEKLKEMSGEKKMEIASSLYDAVLEIVKSAILSSNPNISKEELNKEVLKRLK